MQKCTSCSRAGDELGTCGSHLTCGQPRPVDPAKDIVLRCELCDKTRAVSASDVMQGKPLHMDVVCPQSDCACVIVQLKPAKVVAPAVPAPVKPADA